MDICQSLQGTKHVNNLHIPINVNYDDIAALIDIYGFKCINPHIDCGVNMSLKRGNLTIHIASGTRIIIDIKHNQARVFNSIYEVYTFLNDNYPEWQRREIQKIAINA